MIVRLFCHLLKPHLAVEFNCEQAINFQQIFLLAAPIKEQTPFHLSTITHLWNGNEVNYKYFHPIRKAEYYEYSS